MPRRKMIDGVPYCSRGHAITGKNAITTTRGYTKCRTCINKYNSEYQRARPEKYNPPTRKVGLPPDTPSIMANYKEPLREVDEGYGYIGTIAYNVEKTHTQCHICGHFFEKPMAHIRAEHNMSVEDYKDKFSLMASMSLTAPKGKRPAWERWQEMTDEQKAEQMRKMREGQMEARAERGEDWVRKRKKSLYEKNLEGSCPDQLLDKILVLSQKLGKTPSFREFQKEYDGRFVHAMNATYGSWGEALDILNMTPSRGGYAAIYTPEAVTEMLVNFKEEYGREAMSSDVGRGLLPSMHTIRRHFGTFLTAKEAAYGGR